jgi:probable F420-dependent oxidoreductase
MAVRIGVGMGLGGFPFESMREFHAWLEFCDATRIDSIWQSDRVVSREIAFEPMTLLSVIAGATRRLKFGTNAIVLPFRDPITFARQCATLDFLSDGRFLPTVGIGATNAPEWEATGRSPKGRGKRADEALEVITRLWASEAADFDGEYYSLKGASISPRPKQQPLPLWLGGASDAAVRRTARYGTGWLAPLQSPAESAVTVQAIREESERIGRPIPEDHYGASIVFRIGKPLPDSDDPHSASKARTTPTDERMAQYRNRIQKMRAVGDASVVLDRIREFRAAGITKFVAIPLARNAQELTEQCRLLDQEVLPHAND